MDKKLGIAIALLAALVAVVIVIADGPLFVAIGVAIAGGLAGTLLPRAGHRNESVGIR